MIQKIIRILNNNIIIIKIKIIMEYGYNGNELMTRITNWRGKQNNDAVEWGKLNEFQAKKKEKTTFL